ncbi:MAG: hypothetical protein KGM17_00400 [Sphingomonadales bacterium]|nr:hypothetical protein [Sphingomonadales bacterium]
MAGAPAAAITPASRFVLPQARAALLQQGRDADGAPVLTLYHRGREVQWDDPRQFAFGEALAHCPRFSGADAAGWGDLGWDAAAPMLAALADAGIIVPDDGTTRPETRHDHQPMPDPLPPAPMTRPRSWMDGESLMAELTGQALDLAWLETVVPVFRTGHLFVDRDGRQVGEANAFPAAARLAVPTDWRGCPYTGNRYQAEKPMNATALKAMRRHWRQMMALLLEVRAAYLDRFPEAKAGWTVGHVERLAVSVLALPSYLALRCDAPAANGTLHPALSNLFRVTDGLRMVVHQMLFLPLYEPMRHPDEAVDAAAILAYADRNYAFHSDHGVCAGPRFMIEDFLGVILDGTVPLGGLDAALEPELAAVLADVPAAMDYAMLGLESYATVFALWPAMARCYEDLHRLLADGAHGAAARAMAARFAGHFAALSQRSFLASEEWRAHRVAVYDDMHARTHAATAGCPPARPLSAALAPACAAETGARSFDTLVSAAAAHFGPGHDRLAAAFAETVMDFLRRGQRTVAIASAIQARTRALLARPHPRAELTLADLNLHNVLMGEDQRSVPFLPGEIGRLLGLDIAVDARAITIHPRPEAGGAPHSPGFRPGESTCASTTQNEETIA